MLADDHEIGADFAHLVQQFGGNMSSLLDGAMQAAVIDAERIDESLQVGFRLRASLGAVFLDGFFRTLA